MWLIGCCYAATKGVWVALRILLGGCVGVAMQQLRGVLGIFLECYYCMWLLGCSYAAAKEVLSVF